MRPSAMHPIDAALALGAAHGLGTTRPRVLKDGSNLIVELRPAPVVVRVATLTSWVRGDPRPYLEREVALTAKLAEARAAIAGPSPLLPAGPHELSGWLMTATAFVEHADSVPAAGEALRALDALHATLAGIGMDLPYLGPVTADLDLAWAAVARIGAIDADGIRRRARARGALLRSLQDAAPAHQPLHGDAFPKNSLRTDAGIVWIDFEDCCSGLVAWDHAVMIRQGREPALEPVLRMRDGDDPIELALGLRALQLEAWTIIHDARAEGRLPLPATFARA